MKTIHKDFLIFLMLITPAVFAEGYSKADQTNISKQSAASYQAKSPQVKRHDFDALLTQPEQLLVIDLRNPHEIATIGGFSAYLNIQADRLQQHLAFIPRDRTIVTVSNHAGRSGRAADLLTAEGFKVAGWLGAQYYEEEGGQLIKSSLSEPLANK